jgi:hypothetical protein
MKFFYSNIENEVDLPVEKYFECSEPESLETLVPKNCLAF